MSKDIEERLAQLLKDAIKSGRNVYITAPESVEYKVAELTKQAEQYIRRGEFWQAIICANVGYELASEHLGAQHRGFAASLNLLGIAYLKAGNYVEAEPLLRQALEVDRQLFGENSADYGKDLNNLGLLYMEMRDGCRSHIDGTLFTDAC